ncbi:MAG: polysaccharide deacetylase family protein [Verrucomicrobiota bacterium]|nr:polysaccharide deacetylase family protein [Verrucomicrobiota bacterium]
MLIRFALLSLVLAVNIPGCKKSQEAAPAGQSSSPSPAAGAAVAAGSATPAATPSKPAVDQNAEVIIYGYHRFVKQVHSAWTEILPEDFEKQMQELKNRGIPVIPMQDLLAWKRGEKNIPPRAAVITFDDGWKSQYDVAWPILKKLDYPLTMFIYTEGVRGGKFGGGEAITWEQLAEMRDAGVDIEAHSATHQDLKKPYDKVTKKHLNPQEYQQWLDAEIGGSKELLEQRLGIKVNCFAVPFGNWNPQVKETAMKNGFEAMFTVYGQPITFRTPNDSIGRYLMEANKPKVFTDAIAMIATSGGGASNPVAQVAATELQTQPASGETIRTAMPLIKANLATFGAVDQGSVKMRVSGLGLVPASFDAKTNTVSYQVTQKIRDKNCTVIVEAMSSGKRVQTQWNFAIEDASAPAPAAATPMASPSAPAKK